MARADKVETVTAIADRFRGASAAVVTEYRGLTMTQLTELRRALGRDTSYTVAKNTLVMRAAADAGVAGLDDLFTGPTAIAFVSGEPVDAAKALRDFAKAHPLLVIKGGLLDGHAVSPDEIRKLADLESREVLLARMAGAMKGTLTKAAVMFNELPSQVARLTAALQEKRTAEGGVDASPQPNAGAAETAVESAETATETDETAETAAETDETATETDETATETAEPDEAAAEPDAATTDA